MIELPIWRYEPVDACEHGATLTRPVAIAQQDPDRPGYARIVGRSDKPFTWCFECQTFITMPTTTIIPTPATITLED